MIKIIFRNGCWKMEILLIFWIFVSTSSAIPLTFFEAALRHVREAKQPDMYTEPTVLLPEYDFIIVGAGPAGCVLANRLSEIPEWKVLLVDAGRHEILLTDVPLLTGYFQFTDYNWHYFMERQPGICEAMVNGLCHWPRGRGVGGSSIINYMIYTRGNRQDFLDLEAAGNYGWGPNETLRYYMKSERAKLSEHPDSPYHNPNGLLNVEDVPYRSVSTTAFLNAAQELGNKILDYNGANQLGYSYLQATLVKGRRASAAKTFLRPIRGRKNLHVVSRTRVLKLLIDERTKSVYGVEYVRNRRRSEAFIRKEVIVSAGALLSPQLLMLSGIGPREHLQELGIPVIQDLRVGKNLQDHISFAGPTIVLDNVPEIFNATTIPGPEIVFQWFRGQGPFTVPGGTEALGYYRTKYNQSPGDQPDIELMMLSGSMNTDAGMFLRKTFNIDDETYNAVWREIDYKSSMSIIPVLLHPESRGEILLKSRNPFDWPRFYGNYYTRGNDAKVMIEGIKEAIRLAETEALKPLGARVHRTPLPKCAHIEFGTDLYWECALSMLSVTIHHQVGTCKMGPKSDPEAVVDPELRVHGIDFLRVADPSIIPKSWSAHTNAPSFMIGEKAADMIKQTWSRY